MPVLKNDVADIEITGTAHDGAGVGRLDGLAVFVPTCAQGDFARVRILKVKKNLAYGKLLEILRPSSDRLSGNRAVPDCSVFGKCGGCAFRHITYEAELAVKRQRVADALSKIGRLDAVPEEILGCDRTAGYRNKAEYPVAMENGRLCIGFYARASHRITGDGSCLLQPECFADALEAFREWIANYHISVYDETTGQGFLRHIYLRYAEATGELMACAVANGNRLPHSGQLADLLLARCPQLKSLILNVNTAGTNVILGRSCVTVWGEPVITDRLCGLKIELSPLSFYQVNREQAEKLYAIAARFCEPRGKTILDLYCGAGTIGLSMAKEAKKIVGVECVADAVSDAQRNAFLNGIRNAEFLCADAGEAAETLRGRGLSPDVVVVDPPRKGCSPETLAAVARMGPERVVYVSCDPATLARDLAVFSQNGYRCERVKPVDMFPRTSHVECVALMSRVKD